MIEVEFSPLVSIGFPVYNGEGFIAAALLSILNQTFGDFELIISNNASTDATEAICLKFAAQDSRIRYICQRSNLGAAGNFKFVLSQARGRYFMWAAGDDVRTPDFLAENVAFLETHQEYVASTCPNCFDGDEDQPDRIVNFSVSGKLEDRYLAFLNNCWKSHGIFYSVMRTDIIRDCAIPGQSFTAVDWAIGIFLASRGGVNRTKLGLAIFGRDGVSSRRGAWRAFRSQRLELVIPLMRFSCYVLHLIKPLPWRPRLRISAVLVTINLKASADQAFSELYEFYCCYLKPQP